VARAARRARWQAEVVGLLLTALGGCASMAPPPGAPPDSTPPRIVAVSPESGATVADLKGDAVIHFDEVIDEMPGGSGGLGAIAGIGRQIVLSPVNGAVDVSWHRTAIHVRPAEGWKPGRVYHLQLLPGVVDLRRNILKQGRTIIFSTGPAFPRASLSGTALLWVEQRALARAVIRAQLLPDTVPYVTLTDSSGNFTLAGIPPGTYRVFAIQDQNANRRLDRREAFDSVTVALDSSASVTLWTFAHDTAGPRLREADVVDSLTFRLQFSQPLDPRVRLGPAQVSLWSLPDTTPVPLHGVWTSAEFDSIQTVARALADSLRRAKDTTARAAPRKDSVPAPRRDAIRARPDTGKAHADTARLRQLLRQRPIPADHFVAQAGQALKPGNKYLVRVSGVMNLNGAKGDGQAPFTVPVPKPAPAPKDSVRSQAPEPPPAPKSP